MNEFLLDIFMGVSHFPSKFGVPLTSWVILLPFVAPPFVFSMGVERSALTHVIRLITAIVLTFLLICLAALNDQIVDWLQSRICLDHSEHSNLREYTAQECDFSLDVRIVAIFIVLIVFGPLLAAFYVGLLEGIWRLLNRRKVRAMGDQFEGLYFSNAMIIAPTIGLLLLICFVTFPRLVG